MIDCEKVIESLEMCYTYSNVEDDQTLVPQSIVLDILALLKEQKTDLQTFSSLLVEITGNRMSKTNYTLDAILACMRDAGWRKEQEEEIQRLKSFQVTAEGNGVAVGEIHGGLTINRTMNQTAKEITNIKHVEVFNG